MSKFIKAAAFLFAILMVARAGIIGTYSPEVAFVLVAAFSVVAYNDFRNGGSCCRFWKRKGSAA